MSKLQSWTGNSIATEEWNFQNYVAAMRVYYCPGDCLIAAVHEYLQSNGRQEDNMLICPKLHKRGWYDISPAPPLFKFNLGNKLAVQICTQIRTNWGCNSFPRNPEIRDGGTFTRTQIFN